MIVVIPTYSGIGPVDQVDVPFAVPDPPVELAHVTCDTPTLSLEIPLTTIELADVATLVMGGDKMVIEGGVVSGPVLGGGLLGGGLVG